MPDPILQMQESLGTIHEQRKVLHTKAVNEERDFTDEEQKEFDKLGQEAESLTTRIARAEQLEKEGRNLSGASGRRTSPEATTTSLETGYQRVEVGGERLADDPCGGYGERGFGQFAMDVYESRNRLTDRLRNWSNAARERAFAAGDGLNSSIGSEGAYLIPTAFGALMDKIALEAAVVRPRATRIPMASQRITFPAVDDTSHATTVFGGVLAYWKSEEAQLTSSKPLFREVELAVHKLTAMAYVSGELLDWSPISLGTWLPNKLGQAIAWKEDDGFINGAGGAGEPVGLLNSLCIVSIGKETGQAAATFVFENVVKMDARIWDSGNRGSIIWIANRTLKTELPKLKVDVGTAGQPIFLPPDGAAGRPLSTLYGYPIVFTEHAKALGTTGDVYLANLGEYLIGDASSKTRADRDMGLKFDYDQVAFRVITYTGGVCSWRSALTPQNGDSLSPIVKLDARS